MLDDRGYVALFKLYLTRAEYRAGPLFRASINGTGRPLSCHAAHHRWKTCFDTQPVPPALRSAEHA